MCSRISNDIIVFISGVPGSGKTTISYELLKKYDIFRIVQETDILREVLRGYNKYLTQQSNFAEDSDTTILPHTELLSYTNACKQCEIMKYSINEIVERQRRKCIPTIICGVHIIPEILSQHITLSNVKYINLYFDCEMDLYTRLKERDSQKYGKTSVPFLFKMNQELQQSTQLLHHKFPDIYTSINVGGLSIEETLCAAIEHIKK